MSEVREFAKKLSQRPQFQSVLKTLRVAFDLPSKKVTVETKGPTGQLPDFREERRYNGRSELSACPVAPTNLAIPALLT